MVVTFLRTLPEPKQHGLPNVFRHTHTHAHTHKHKHTGLRKQEAATRPQNQAGASGHLLYKGTAPIFVTCKLPDLDWLIYKAQTDLAALKDLPFHEARAQTSSEVRVLSDLLRQFGSLPRRCVLTSCVGASISNSERWYLESFRSQGVSVAKTESNIMKTLT